MTVKELFEEMKVRINNACDRQNYKAINSEELGFLVQDLNNGNFGGNLIHEFYKVEVDKENSIEIDFRCYDQSKAFSIQPDMNKFQMKWKRNNTEVETYTNYYED